MQQSIFGETPDSLTALFKDWKQPAYRVGQVFEWLYKKRARTWDDMTNLPKALRGRLSERFVVNPSELTLIKQAGDVTEKLLLRQQDGRHIETVLIRAPQTGVGQESARKTICISTQVGCAYGCRFCASGLDGWTRNLSAAEIISQVLHVCNIEDQRNAERGMPSGEDAPFDNIVVMGMGEPLANYDNLVQAIRAINAEWGLRFGARRITVSTSGLVPQILKLADEPIQFRLAISLHAATNAARSEIMPVNRKYPLEQLIPAAKVFAEKHGRMLTLEYILIEDVNDTFEQADALVKIARDLHAHVNLIPYNPVEGLPWLRPSLSRQKAFSGILRQARISHTIRMEKGADIDAACGQLRLRKERGDAETDAVSTPS